MALVWCSHWLVCCAGVRRPRFGGKRRGRERGVDKTLASGVEWWWWRKGGRMEQSEPATLFLSIYLSPPQERFSKKHSFALQT